MKKALFVSFLNYKAFLFTNSFTGALDDFKVCLIYVNLMAELNRAFARS